MVESQGGVGVVGLGAIGAPVAERLVQSGRRVLVWNRTAAVADSLVAQGCIAASLEEMGRTCPVVLTVLPDLREVDEVLLAGLRKGLLEAVSGGAQPILVVMGTVSPLLVQDLGERLDADGICLVDAPVSGGDVGAQRGELSMMAGGPVVALERVADVLDPACGVLRRMGELGAGSLAKACNQVVVGATLAALSEALLLGRAGGLDDDVLLDVLAGGLAGSKALEVKRTMWATGDFTPGGRAKFQLKDLRFALESARESNLPMPITHEVKAQYDALVAAGGGEDDHAAIIKVLGADESSPD